MERLADVQEYLRYEARHDLGRDDFAVLFALGFICVLISSVIAFFCFSWSQITAAVCVFVGFLIWRHVSITREPYPPQRGRRWISDDGNTSVPDTSRLPAVYFFYVLGSGGHTTEMLDIIKQKFRPQANQHRRYLVTIGDQDSLSRVARLEAQIHNACAGDNTRGTLDTFQVPRARRVHQPFWTAPLTCGLTAVYCINALTREPEMRPRARHSTQFKYPHVIVTNGPATGFVVCAVAHLLKMLYLVPDNRLKMVYVESWARSRTLSLTGRLFWRTNIANMFCVQHEELAQRLDGAVYLPAPALRGSG
ncbi:glycosyltransferase family 1 protein [Chaetomium strumarium]|uniref:UDP-N-acetylglucosamine transferase subunit ALG14 n=1 Tax=Chaetomium strumarium TaxID=1170767 RepID=A0AAJ0M060_9PEZI|nr:glycosyltransferase family 1 protein [Chaetomium strumarium]